MIQITDPRLKLTDQVFTHIDEDGTIRNFAVDVFNRHLTALCYPITSVHIDEEMVANTLRERGIEGPRIKRLVKPWLDLPAILCKFPDDTCLMIDGHHRLVKRASMGIDFIYAFIVPQDDWKHFLISGLPDNNVTAEKLLKSKSGVR